MTLEMFREMTTEDCFCNLKIVNLSSKELTDGQIKLLLKGLKFTPTLKKDMSEISANIQNFCTNLWKKEFFEDKSDTSDTDESLAKKINKLKELHDILNSLDDGIQLSAETSCKELPFLDVMIRKDNTHLTTDIYYKLMDSVQYLPSTSSHPRHIKNNIPYNLARRICLIVEDQDIRKYRLHDLKQILLRKQYPAEIIDYSVNKAFTQTTEEQLCRCWINVDLVKKGKEEKETPVRPSPTEMLFETYPDQPEMIDYIDWFHFLVMLLPDVHEGTSLDEGLRTSLYPPIISSVSEAPAAAPPASVAPSWLGTNYLTTLKINKQKFASTNWVQIYLILTGRTGNYYLEARWRTVSKRVNKTSLEGVVEQEDVEAQGLAYSTNPQSATFSATFYMPAEQLYCWFSKQAGGDSHDSNRTG
ncbi:hypothetical protein pdam_00011136 [Pocillopora damicornis]|uniref:Helix-turn-helix domain-containing protein n=1 Tax=Pocillopora damicornis TaxID=46731 RepID=A0A3M6U4E6_POCDA|nr:hypothetical protein pdam_00011136 [Pocillopora damicornis]